MFTQVGVIVLICLYMVAGAFIFQHIEQDSLLEHALEAEQVIAVLDIIHLSTLFPLCVMVGLKKRKQFIIIRVFYPTMTLNKIKSSS